jgi:hypothetical protein
MATLIIFLIFSVGLQVGASDLDTAFKAFLTPSLAPKSFQEYSIAVKDLYKLYKIEFYRPSMTSVEEKTRFASFNDTVYILLQDYQQGDKTYTVGLNKYADWTADELQTLRGLRRPQGKISSTNAEPNQHLLTLDGNEIQSKASVVVPPSFDYTTQVVTGTNTPIVSMILLLGFKFINFYISVNTSQRSRSMWVMLCIRFYRSLGSSICFPIEEQCKFE